ncbi:MAG: hypothetical protein PHN84_03265 [Desulfuromonadaceae bacterium]|nr:hypothetical protein [Desulfuromonadaceae bacterium]MDD2856281.1 hypothetical protein [Desulfuromonadaceae bacterium]
MWKKAKSLEKGGKGLLPFPFFFMHCCHMSIEPLKKEPSIIYAGDTINWLITLPDYPASAGWTLKYNAVAAGGRFALSSAPSSDDHAVTAASAATSAYPAGTYSLTKYVEHTDTTRVTLAELSLIVKPDLAGTVSATDTRGHVKKMLDAIEAVLEGTATTDQAELTIDGTTIKRRSVTDLLALRSRYLEYWKQEQQAANMAAGIGGNGNKILVRFK